MVLQNYLVHFLTDLDRVNDWTCNRVALWVSFYDGVHINIYKSKHFDLGLPWQRYLWWDVCTTSLLPCPGQMCIIRSHQQGAAVSRPVSLQRLDIRSIIKWSVPGRARTATSEYWRSCGVAQWWRTKTRHCQMDWLLTRFTRERVDCWSRFCKLQIPLTDTSCLFIGQLCRAMHVWSVNDWWNIELL